MRALNSIWACAMSTVSALEGTFAKPHVCTRRLQIGASPLRNSNSHRATSLAAVSHPIPNAHCTGSVRRLSASFLKRRCVLVIA